MIFTGKSGRNYLFVGVASSSIKVCCTYQAYDNMDEITDAFLIGFNQTGTKLYPAVEVWLPWKVLEFLASGIYLPKKYLDSSMERPVRKIVILDDHVALACAGLKADAPRVYCLAVLDDMLLCFCNRRSNNWLLGSFAGSLAVLIGYK
ncbi:hypothetical protein Tco_0568719 [Tanacetum coccineum]